MTTSRPREGSDRCALTREDGVARAASPLHMLGWAAMLVIAHGTAYSQVLRVDPIGGGTPIPPGREVVGPTDGTAAYVPPAPPLRITLDGSFTATDNGGLSPHGEERSDLITSVRPRVTYERRSAGLDVT